MAKKIAFYPRHIKALFLEGLRDSPLTLIHGPRQCGKTTLALMVGKLKKYDYISFDNDEIVSSAKADPVGFVRNLPKKVILDEAQKAPQIFSALKTAIDKKRHVYGRFILTGSANILRMKKLSDSLAGRMKILRLHPLSQEELNRRQSYFLDDLFNCKFKAKKAKSPVKSFLMDQIVSGGYPPALSRPVGRRRADWHRDYIETLIQRDIRDISKARSIDILPRLLALSAGQTAQLVNFSNLASAFQVSRPTICDYVALLEQMFFLERLPPWHSRYLKRLVKTPKIHISDTGLACALLNLSRSSLGKTPALLGQLTETFVFQELKRQASYNKHHHSFFHYRDKKGTEVDIVIERDYMTAGLEVKSSATVYMSDFKGLRKIKETLGKRFICGVVFYNGDRSLSFGNSLYAVPLQFLWH